ncbi:MAG: YggS family pyridoxal phosphate-dependent enzyme [Candidatus Omnitrophica bacterium]|nr:YggS family pyridoxal phosphate-dependent enzyme [Candidatus Omnitrophota bacterium]
MIRENIARIREEISAVCGKIGRDPKEIRIIAVSKGRSIEEIEEVLACGITDIGENKVQEAKRKIKGLSAKLHMVGHLQSNKSKGAVELFDLIHSVDSFELAEAIDKQAAKLGKVQDILIEVNTSGEKSKFGIRPDDLILLIGRIRELKHIRVKGLMTMAPVADNPEEIRPYFRKLRELRDREHLAELSMGMSDDYKVAIEEGATIVRLGRAIFEK